LPTSALTRVKECPYPATDSGAERRVVDMVFAWADGDHALVLCWLRRLGCKVERMGEEEWFVDGLTGVRCGLCAGHGPLDLFAQFGMILAGIFWVYVFPNLPKMVDARLKDRTRAAKVGDSGAQVAEVVVEPPLDPSPIGAPVPKRLPGHE
jgi:hypothetical protein